MDSRRNFLKQTGLLLASMPILGAANKIEALNLHETLPSHDDPAYWGEIRKMFPMPLDEGYLNTGTIGATPQPVLDAMTGHFEEYARNIAKIDWTEGGIKIITGYFPHDSLRKKLGVLMNADYKQLGLIKNAHMGMNMMAFGLDLSAGDEVIQTNIEHTGGKSGWEVIAKRNGIVIKQIEIKPPIQNPESIIDMVNKLITKKTKVIALPHILSVPGDILPIKDICSIARKKGIITVIDGAQAIGQIPVDVKDLGCDAYFTSPHKWLLAPAGSGVLYISEELAPKVWPVMPSGVWDNHEDEGFRFTQRGTENSALMVGFEAAVDFHNLIGNKRITDRVKFLGDYLRNKLQQSDVFDIYSTVHPGMCAGLTTYGVKGVSGKTLQNEMWKREKLQPRPVGPEGQYIRFSTHFYVSTDEIDRALKVGIDLA
ncbi:MAG: aminotransferase class V-fold PLP-dependent enzyme [Bacteroidales bacterium]|nr:aminotransferase class V-fold PLP-dependent enzyme [Bacteroidales bacterium]